MKKNETIFSDLLSIIIKNKGLYLYTVLLSLFSLLCKRNVTLSYSKRYRNVTATVTLMQMLTQMLTKTLTNTKANALAVAFTYNK